MPQDPIQHRPVAGDQHAIDRVRLLGADAAADQVTHQHRDQRHRQTGGGRHRVGLGIGQRREQPALLGLQCEHRHERQGDHQQAGEQRRTDFAGRDGHQFPAFLALRVAPVDFAPVFQVLVCVLDHHHRGVYHRADGDGDAAQRQQVGGDARASPARNRTALLRPPSPVMPSALASRPEMPATRPRRSR